MHTPQDHDVNDFLSAREVDQLVELEELRACPDDDRELDLKWLRRAVGAPAVPIPRFLPPTMPRRVAPRRSPWRDPALS